MDAIESERDHACYTFVALTGLRQSEVVALRWDSVDLDAGTLRVERSFGKGMDGAYDKRPKSKAGKRVVELDAELVALLRSHRKAQTDRRVAPASGFRSFDFMIFAMVTRPSCSPLTCASMSSPND